MSDFLDLDKNMARQRRIDALVELIGQQVGTPRMDWALGGLLHQSSDVPDVASAATELAQMRLMELATMGDVDMALRRLHELARKARK